MSSDDGQPSGPALEKAYQFMVWLVPVMDAFPQRQKYLLGDRIQTTALDTLEGLIEATYSRSRGGILATVNVRLSKLRFLFRLANDLHLIDRRRYEHAARSIDDIGRLVGGWMKVQRGQTTS
ncbi:MAG: diversity-generating retroelement protein Avd [Rhodospirillaceae bacterium]